MPQAPQTVRVPAEIARYGSSRVRDAIDERLTQELIIAMVGPVGSGVSTTASIVSEIMPARFGYEARDIIKLSKLIDEDAHKVRRPKSIGLLPHDRIKHLQETGNALR